MHCMLILPPRGISTYTLLYSSRATQVVNDNDNEECAVINHYIVASIWSKVNPIFYLVKLTN